MKDFTFITGNQPKADYLARYLGYPIKHHKLDLDEIQSLDLKEVVEHKLKQAYNVVHTPVVVEDVSLEFAALNRLPGTFIKFFELELSYEKICRLIDGMNREAIAKCVFGYTDGKEYKFFESGLRGKIADHESGDGGFGFDKIFIPDGYSVTRASLNEEDNMKTYAQIKPLVALKTFLEN